MPWKPDRALMLGLAVLVCAVGVGLLADVALAGYFGLSALLVSGARGPRRTGAMGAVALLAAVLSGLWDDRFGEPPHLAAIGLVAAQSAVAVWIAVHRSRRELELRSRESELRSRESELRQVRAIADVAQRALLPAVPATIDGARFAARYLSAAEEATVGGDLYEVVATTHTTRVIIGDVRGKGLPAVRLASVVLGAFREAAVTWLEPEQVAAACARAVNREADVEDFVTALLVDIHPDGRLSLCSAGHHPPVLLPGRAGDHPDHPGLADLPDPLDHPDPLGRPAGLGGGPRDPDGDDPTAGGPVRLKSPSPPFGLAERFTPSAARWDVGDRLLLFTDGLIEARSPGGEFFPLEQHLDVLLGGSPEQALDRLTERVTAHAGGHLRDDLAMLLIERLPLAVEPTVPRQLSPGVLADERRATGGSGESPVVRLGPGDEPGTTDGGDEPGTTDGNGGVDEDARGPAPSGWRRLRAGRAHRAP
ncbi:serine/threonine-protein phosphatase [Frankia sp. CNm7]|uniref:Serine/threonine-protein phosphatase n=1 Tax=Frankia nepalensis TaxID=1836974 RepID=A0A937RHW5_9ACTN|nr:PP2C family protein-serine/threonine phosphatase [Frankia nepalensis]MBL7500304.1 serine/threonine-protein phosphatase [Frankia nepalensis]MBL7508526.1 serine/threonine-protein phosphatase [Frankia nepalensis]MBL7520433.1 serine/threonine-protein phosphatase [Frankia nepalensis]MBL7627654.1 serine/threonine-protein phosphatase [Frankia nepalensis]